jgi:hypothetical protein
MQRSSRPTLKKKKITTALTLLLVVSTMNEGKRRKKKMGWLDRAPARLSGRTRKKKNRLISFFYALLQAICSPTQRVHRGCRFFCCILSYMRRKRRIYIWHYHVIICSVSIYEYRLLLGHYGKRKIKKVGHAYYS